MAVEPLFVCPETARTPKVEMKPSAIQPPPTGTHQGLAGDDDTSRCPWCCPSLTTGKEGHFHEPDLVSGDTSTCTRHYCQWLPTTSVLESHFSGTGSITTSRLNQEQSATSFNSRRAWPEKRGTRGRRGARALSGYIQRVS